MGSLNSKDRRHFRGATYSRNVLLGKRTVKDGECALVWDISGVCKRHQGPRRIWLVLSQVVFLDRNVADEQHYLEVKFRDGRTEMLRGPAALFEDPVLHKSVRVLDAIRLDSTDVCVVYKEERSPDGNNVSNRRIVRGPAVFFPEPSEWLHQFSWTPGVQFNTGSVDNSSNGHAASSTRPITAHSVNISLAPAQLGCRCSGARTRDDARLEVDVLISYAIVDVERLIHSTQDATGDMSAACVADLTTLASSLPYSEFLQTSARLSQTATYPALLARADAIGVRVLEVASVGYRADGNVEAVHKKSMEERAKLKAQLEAVEQEQEQLDMQQRRAAERAKSERAAEADRAAFELEQTRLKFQEAMARRQAEHDAALREDADKVHEQEKAESRHLEMQAEHLEKLKKFGVDLTQYLVSQNKRPADNLIQIEGSYPAHLHLDAAPAAK